MSDSFVADLDRPQEQPPAARTALPPRAAAPDPGDHAALPQDAVPDLNRYLFPRANGPAAERTIDAIRKMTEAIEAYTDEAEQVAGACQDLEREIAGILRELGDELGDELGEASDEAGDGAPRPGPVGVPAEA